jgi:hypothetical protein
MPGDVFVQKKLHRLVGSAQRGGHNQLKINVSMSFIKCPRLRMASFVQLRVHPAALYDVQPVKLCLAVTEDV